MIAKHTPGPWQRSGVRQSITDFKGHAVGPDGDPVVIVPYNDKQHAECLANADLIAAAPELLEALQACASILPRYYLSGKTVGEDEEHSAVLERVLEAVAKAEGRT